MHLEIYLFLLVANMKKFEYYIILLLYYTLSVKGNLLSLLQSDTH